MPTFSQLSVGPAETLRKAQLIIEDYAEVHDLLVEFRDVLEQITWTLVFTSILKVSTGDAQPVGAKLERSQIDFEKDEEAYPKKNKLLDNGVIVPMVRCVIVQTLEKQTGLPKNPILLPKNGCLKCLEDMAQDYYQSELNPRDHH